MKTLQEHKAEATLKKVFKYNEGIMTRGEWIDMQKKKGSTVKEVLKSKTRYNRNRYNRMNAHEQKLYEERMNKKETCYELHLPDGGFYDITKAEFDYFNKQS